MQITSDYFRCQQRSQSVFGRSSCSRRSTLTISKDLKPLQPSLETLRSLAELRKPMSNRRVA